MAITQRFEFTGGDGKSIDAWAAATLTGEELTAYKNAVAATKTARDALVASGDLSIDESGAFVWANLEASGTHLTPEWLEFFDRYLAETGTSFNDIQE